MQSETPIVAIISARGAPLLPGLERLADSAELYAVDSVEDLVSIIPNADVLVVVDIRDSAVRDAWPHAKRLTWVHAASAGVDRLLFPGLVESDVVLTNARGIFDRSIAETILGWILFFAKDTGGSIALQHAHRWRHRETERIEGTIALIVGAGSIGREAARLLRGAGLVTRGVASRRRESDPDFDEVGGPDDLFRMLGEADWVILTAPLTADTTGLIGAPELRSMKRTARLLNVGRGPIVRTDALVASLRTGEIAGAALDVFEQEPLPENHPLWDLPSVLVSPHMAGDFYGWREALGAQFVKNFHRWRAGEPLANVVDKRRGYGAK